MQNREYAELSSIFIRRANVEQEIRRFIFDFYKRAKVKQEIRRFIFDFTERFNDEHEIRRFIFDFYTTCYCTTDNTQIYP